MRDGKHSTSLHEFVQLFLNYCFRLAIERRRSLVEDKYWRVLQHRARNRYSLPLPAGEPHAAVANNGIESPVSFWILKGFNEIKCPYAHRYISNFVVSEIPLS